MDYLKKLFLSGALLSLVAFLFPIGMGTIKHWTSGLYYLAVVIALIILGRGWAMPEGRIKWFFAFILLLLGVALLSMINAEDMSSGLRRLEKMVGFLCLVPLCLAIDKIKLDLSRPFLFGLLVTGPVMAAIAYYSVHVQGLARAKGHYYSIALGDLSVLLAILVFIALMVGRLSGWHACFGVFAILCGLYASMMSGTRGAWLALPIVVVFVLWLLRHRLNKLNLAISVAGIVIVLFVGLAVMPNQIVDRLTDSQQNIEAFLDLKETDTSEGIRLLLWRTAIEIWLDNPLIGTGLGDFRQETIARIEEGTLSLNKDWGHAHNIFLDTLATMGTLGLLVFMMTLFVLPAQILFRIGVAREKKTSDFPVIAGLASLLCFGVFGLTEGWVARSPMLTVYLFCLVVFLTSAKLAGRGNYGNLVDCPNNQE
ncbi:O-antigen ligase family protein [Pelovirga terrestris]|uniref:O-antigen ligase family protein n=1 Tax=Pelovirga terrestris TaxID=2771352 RepID=A0A8J6QXS0_9BACT|nr:O-antigen ligase family protein [Pelovirga terrestris]MBD1401016.1 O-antigen ligase family protein [Pelovirga terrestris]